MIDAVTGDGIKGKYWGWCVVATVAIPVAAVLVLVQSVSGIGESSMGRRERQVGRGLGGEWGSGGHRTACCGGETGIRVKQRREPLPAKMPQTKFQGSPGDTGRLDLDCWCRREGSRRWDASGNENETKRNGTEQNTELERRIGWRDTDLDMVGGQGRRGREWKNFGQPNRYPASNCPPSARQASSPSPATTKSTQYYPVSFTSTAGCSAGRACAATCRRAGIGPPQSLPGCHLYTHSSTIHELHLQG